MWNAKNACNEYQLKYNIYYSNIISMFNPHIFSFIILMISVTKKIYSVNKIFISIIFDYYHIAYLRFIYIKIKTRKDRMSEGIDLISIY